MKTLNIPTLFMKNIYLTLLSFTLYITPSLASETPNDAFQSALEGEHVERIQELVTADKVDVNLQNRCGETALMLVTFENHITLAELLIKHHNINVNLQDKFGNTALMFAIFKEHIAFAQKIIQRDDIDLNVQNDNKDTVLTLAIDGNHIKLAQQLVKRHDLDINLQNECGETALMLAIKKNHIKLTQQLLKREDIDLNVQNTDGDTALMLAIDESHLTLAKKLLTSHNIDVNTQNKNGYTALMYIIDENHITLAKILFQRDDLDVNLQNKSGETALMLAVYRHHVEIAKQLLKRQDMDINLQSRCGATALAYIKDKHIELNKLQDNDLYYVSLVKRTHIPSLYKKRKHSLLQEKYLYNLYKQEPFTQATKQYTDILLINKIANKLQEKQKTLFYQGCLLAYESKNSHYSIQAKNIERPKKSSYYQPVLDEDLTHLLANYLRKVNMKRVSYASDWVSLITCYLWTNNQFALQHNPANMSLKAIHFWSNHNSTYAELLSTANHTQKRALFKVVAQQDQYQAIATQHLARGLKKNNIIQNEEQVLEKSITQLTPIIVASLKALTC